MEGVNIKDIIVYQEDHQDYAKYFSKRASISDFKKIDATRIKKEFVVCSCLFRLFKIPLLRTRNRCSTKKRMPKIGT